MTDLKKLQKEMAEWQNLNFPGREPWMPLLGVGEEVGELNHAYLKMRQGIRGNSEEHQAAMIDAVGDTIIFLMNFCSDVGIDVEDALLTTWREVQKRDWRKNPYTGSEV